MDCNVCKAPPKAVTMQDGGLGSIKLVRPSKPLQAKQCQHQASTIKNCHPWL